MKTINKSSRNHSYESIDPNEIQFTPRSKKINSRFSTPRPVSCGISFIEEEEAMKAYENQINNLKRELQKYNLEELKREQETQYNEIESKINERKESLYKTASQIDNSEEAKRLKENFEILNSLKEEISYVAETNEMSQKTLFSLKKNLESTKYAMKILPNDTDDVYEIAKKMIFSNISFPVEKGEMIQKQLQNKYFSIKNENELLKAFVAKLSSENEQLESSINDLNIAVQSLAAERTSLLQGKALQVNQYAQPKYELDKQLHLIHKEFKNIMQEEKDRIKKDIGALKVEFHIQKMKYDWSKKQANDLQEELEKLNSDIVELSYSYSSSPATPPSSFEKTRRKRRVHKSKTPK